MPVGNRIGSEAVERQPISKVRCVRDPLIIESEYPAYLLDESKLTGSAKHLFFPRTEGELASVIDFLISKGGPISVSGARTGITGSGVPRGGGIVSTENMDRVLGIGWDEEEGRYFARCESGVSLVRLGGFLETADLELLDPSEGRERFVGGGHHYPVDPTEMGATIGGTLSTNASGARTFRYGPTRDWVRRIRVMLPSGQVLDITRGHVFEEEGKFIISLVDGESIEVPVPRYEALLEEGVKNAAGIFSQEGMDLIDLFIGSEGLLGIITLVEVWLEEQRSQFSVVQFVDDLESGMDLVHLLRGEIRIEPEFIEMMDGHCLDMLREVQREMPHALGVPNIPEDAGTAIMFDLPYLEDITPSLEVISSLVKRCGSSLDRSWCGYERRELERLSHFRHSAPETVNAIIAARKREHPDLHKLGTDISVPDRHIEEMMSYYSTRMEDSGLEYVIFGHIGDNHPHVNILPRDRDEMARGKELYMDFARRAVELGGSVSAEHGIGKIKRELLQVMYGEEGIEGMRKVKRSLDPEGILNPGNMFELEAVE